MAALRATMLLDPPGAKGTTRRIGFVGQVCAYAGNNTSAATAATKYRVIRVIRRSPLQVGAAYCAPA